MRGIVTLAAALALPTEGRAGSAFPYRDLILFVAFCVALGTLVIQGMTLRPLMNVLRLEDDGSVGREVRLARIEILRAAPNATAGLRAEEIAGLLHRRLVAERFRIPSPAARPAASGRRFPFLGPERGVQSVPRGPEPRILARSYQILVG
jgi:NhaP-type Na+/H+ or K+/H+ antiporter